LKILITGICGFVGSTLAKGLIESGHQVMGIDNLIRPGSHLNVAPLKQMGAEVIHGDIRIATDLETLPKVDWVLDCAANASVLAGVDGKTSSRQLVEHNLQGTINLLEYCRKHQAGFTLLSTSRVYSIPPLVNLPLKVDSQNGKNRFTPDLNNKQQITKNGLKETFSTQAPVSLYGATKLASEQLALEYGYTYDFPVWINRCGVMAGAGQFGHPAQGIFAYWIHSFAEGKPLKYIGFDGKGRQVRDCLHPKDLLPLIEKQFASKYNEPGSKHQEPSIINCAGGASNSMSLAELTDWCNDRFKTNFEPQHDPQDRPFDIPWMILDSTLAKEGWDWAPVTSLTEVCQNIADFAEENLDWLRLSQA